MKKVNDFLKNSSGGKITDSSNLESKIKSYEKKLEKEFESLLETQVTTVLNDFTNQFKFFKKILNKYLNTNIDITEHYFNFNSNPWRFDFQIQSKHVNDMDKLVKELKSNGFEVIITPFDEIFVKIKSDWIKQIVISS